MKTIQRLNASLIRAKWKTIAAVAIVSIASFSMGAFANQVIVQQIQSLAGNHVLVPAPELQINSTVWNINGTSSMITGVTLHVITVGGPNVTKLYQIFIQVSCLKLPVLPNSTEFTCATGNGTIPLPANGGSGSLVVPISPQIDPELIEVHDLSFIVTGTPTPTPTCTPTFTVTHVPPALNITRSSTGTVFATITKLITYTGNCPSASVTLATKVGGPSPGVSATVAPPVITLPPSPVVVTETIAIQPSALPGPYTVTEIDTSGPVVVTVTTIVNVF